MTFADRADAGRQLAQQLMGLASEAPYVLALPRGGIIPAAEIAQALHAPLDVLIARKLGAPFEPEFGFGAIAEGGAIHLNRESVQLLGLTAEDIERIAAREMNEIQRRASSYRKGRSLPELRNRTVILVDDGMATGGTAQAAILSIRDHHPRRLVLAVPVAPAETVEALRPQVDDLLCLEIPPHFFAVGEFYDSFPQIEDGRVIELLDRAQGTSGASPAVPSQPPSAPPA